MQNHYLEEPVEELRTRLLTGQPRFPSDFERAAHLLGQLNPPQKQELTQLSLWLREEATCEGKLGHLQYLTAKDLRRISELIDYLNSLSEGQ